METLIGIVLAILLAGNVVQYSDRQNLKQDVQELTHERNEAQIAAVKNDRALEVAKNVNVANGITIENLDILIRQCNADLDWSTNRINYFREVEQMDTATIDELKRKLAISNDQSDSDSCVVPNWVSVPQGNYGLR